MRALLAWLKESLTTARCTGCPNRVPLIGPWWGTRRACIYCDSCLSVYEIQPRSD